MSTEDAETLKLLWKPNLEIYGLQEFKKHNILSEMAGLRVSRSKRIIFDIKATIVVSCQMSFNDYPFDGHTCYFQVGSYFYDKNSMTCTSDFHDPKSSNIQERNLQYHIRFRDLRRSRGVVRLHSGNYAACGFEVILQRKHEPLIYQVTGSFLLSSCKTMTISISRFTYPVVCSCLCPGSALLLTRR